MKISDHANLEIVLILVGILLSLIFLDMSEIYWKSDAHWIIQIIFSFIVASLIFGAIGLILEQNSRTGGIFVLAVFLPIAYVFSGRGFLRIDSFMLGMLLSVYLSYYSYVNNRFDKLAVYSCRFIKFFFVSTTLYLIYAANIIIMYFDEIPQFRFSSSNNVFKFIIMIGSLVVFSFLLTKTIHGIRAYDVFIYGPSGSGKSLLLLAFYKHFITFYKGVRKEFIYSSTNEENLKIESMLVALENGDLPKSNLRTDLAMYKLSGKNRFKPVGITFVDYGGEHTDNFDQLLYTTTIKELRELFYADVLKLKKAIENAEPSNLDKMLTENISTSKLKEILGDADASELNNILNDAGKSNDKKIMKKKLITKLDKKLDELERKLGDLDGIQDLQDKSPNKFAENIEKIIFTFIYRRFESAGKIIFLVDGDHIVNYHKDGDIKGKNELIKLFGRYSKIISKFGNEKSYAIVVTKIDKFEKISDTLEDSIEAKAIEHKIYDLFCEIDTFKEIVHMVDKTSIYLYVVSVDANLEPHIVGEDTETQGKNLKIHPWRVGEIEKFSF